ncbi:MAG: divalent-cation tolerance protein CutA [Calditrichaeota bacterium]|nr:divalent-cation tolerance protein CutA [Calditrichota bacterium]
MVVFVTAPAVEQAEHIAQALVGERLAACVSVVPNVTSCYRWQGELCKDQEVLLIVKTRASLFDAVAAKVRALHSYQVPEILALPVRRGAESYLRWLAEETRRDEDRG